MICSNLNTNIPRRSKFSYNPNNTSWTSSADSYGQRMLQSHGWTPGASLGARNKSYTRAVGISHIKVTLKDDSLGLGAKSGPNVPQPGLDAFQGLLGRLNGKTDTVLAKEQSTRDDLKRRTYAERRWGGFRFVSGGLLVGDRIEAAKITPDADSTVIQNIPEPTSCTIMSTSADVGDSEKLPNAVDDGRADADTKVAKKSTKRRKHAKLNEEETAVQEPTVDNSMPNPGPNPSTSVVGASESASETDKVRRRAEKAQRKLERRIRKAEKQAARAKRNLESEPTMTKVEARDDSVTIVPSDGAKKPNITLTKRDQGGRNAVRQRYIIQKRMALADSRALNEVCHINHKGNKPVSGSELELTGRFADIDD